MSRPAPHPTVSNEAPASIFRNRNFILLWCAYTTSALGDHLSEMALLEMQEATNRPDSTRITAIMLFVFMLPFAFFGPVMGYLADRLPRKWVMISADVVRALVLFSLYGCFVWLFDTFAGTALEVRPAGDGKPALYSPWLYASPLFAVGLFAAMFSPARAAMLPSLIRSEQIVRGNGLMNAMGPIASIVSYIIGGYLVVRYGPTLNFRINGLTFLISALFIIFIRPPQRSALHLEGAPRRTGLLDGLAYCRGHRRVIELIIFALLFWSAAGVVRSVIPALVGHVFGGSVKDIGYYNASLGIGMLSGALLLAYLGDAIKSEIAVCWSLKGAGAAVIWLAIVAQFQVGKISGGVGLFLTGMFGSGVLVGTNALIQKIVPDFFRGRVFGVKDVVTMLGLLTFTGLLGIPAWENIDDYVVVLLSLVGIVLLSGGVWASRTRLRRGRFGLVITFWKNLNEFYCRFWARVRRVGVCTVPAEGPVIVAANHVCTLDPFLLTATSPNRYVSFMIAREFARLPLFRHLVEMVECVPVNRTGSDVTSVKAALRHLEQGRCLGIFPQGRIQFPDEAIEVREGVGMLALRSGATIVPAYISGVTQRPFPGKKYGDFMSLIAPLVRRHHAEVRYGPPIDLSAWKGREKDREAYREVAEHIMEQINALALIPR